MNLKKDGNKAETKTQDYPTTKIWWKRKRHEDYPASVALHVTDAGY